MLKVFLAEDETLIREGLRDNIPWEQYGYRFVGEAAAVIESNREGRTPKNKDYYHQRV